MYQVIRIGEIFASDYSQIELRVLAHISKDPHMQQAFKDDFDIHANTAMRIFGLDDPSQVTANMRRQAKAVNFGIVYGISDFGLAQSIGSTRKQAKEFMETYLALISEYINTCKISLKVRAKKATLKHFSIVGGTFQISRAKITTCAHLQNGLR